MTLQANPATPRVNVYVDGFNLYYGSVKDTPYKWLDLSRLCAELLPGETICRIRYFTALVNPSPTNPDQRLRQETYLRALKTIPTLTVKYGYFLLKQDLRIPVYPLFPPNAAVPNPANAPILVWKVEEKGSDVNLATSLLLDAAANDFDAAWVITNDSDLAWPIEMARRTYRLPVGVFKPDRPASYPSPRPRPDSWPLMKSARSFRRIEERHLVASQFAATLADALGPIVKPVSW